MHERWRPNAIAQVITDLDYGPSWRLSQRIVMALSQIPQLAPQKFMSMADANVPPATAGIGKCQKCHNNDAVLYVEEPIGSGEVKRYCGSCAPLPAEADEERVAKEAGA